MILSASATKITSENRARIYKTDDKREEEEEEEEEERKGPPAATERESARKLVVYLLFFTFWKSFVQFEISTLHATILTILNKCTQKETKVEWH
jgi:hypothetical protein